MDQPRLRAATLGTSAAFVLAGFAFASWASRIPQVRDRLTLSPAELGWLLLSVAAGSVVALPLAGKVIGHLGTRRTVAVSSLALAASLAVVAVGYLVGVGTVAAGLFALGFANGTWDVAMNVQAAEVERGLRRSVMARFHAGFSVGTVVGALTGTVMVALDVPVTAHLMVVAGVVALVVPPSVRGFLADHPAEPGDGGPGHWAAWTEPRTLAVGVFVLAFAFAEGVGNDWIAVAMIDGYDAAPALGTLTFALFLGAMTLARWVGPALLDRWGRVRVVRGLSGVGLVGLLLFVFGPSLPVAYAGAVLWGTGVALGFPVGMSAGSDDPARAASRVSVIASLGYCAFLAGPPVVGFLGEQVGVLRGLVSVAVLLGLAGLLADSVREQEPSTTGPPARDQA